MNQTSWGVRGVGAWLNVFLHSVGSLRPGLSSVRTLYPISLPATEVCGSQGREGSGTGKASWGHEGGRPS